MKAFRKPISILLALLMIAGAFFVIPFSVAAEEETEVLSGATGDCTWTLEDGVLTISGNGRMANYFHEDNPWYSYRDSIVEANIEKGVENIGDKTFSDCTGLTSIDIPDSVTYIGESAFSGCTGLADVNLHIKDLESFCNGSYSQIKSSLEGRNIHLFMNGEPLTEIDIPDSVTSIDFRVFSHCTDITSICIPKHLRKIQTVDFYGCINLTSITVDPENRNYDSRDNCNAVIDKKNNALLLGCKSTIIPESVTSIGYGAFSYCTGLTSVTIPNSVNSIGDYAFYGCKELTSVTIPKSVTEIGDKAFGYCYGNGFEKIDGFKIYGYEGSAADDYAWNNIFDFVRITEDPTQPVTTEPTNPEADTTEVVTAEPTQPVTDNPTELNTETVEPEKPEFITYYYQPSQEQIDAGNKFVVSVTAKNGVTYSYVMSLCEKEIGGAPVYGADVPYGIEIDEMYFQVYDGETWTSQIAVSPETAEGAVVKYDGNIIDLNPENPAESKETQAYIDNPTAPQPTAPVVTDPQPTDVQPTGIAPTSPSVNPDNKKKNNPMKVTVKKKTVKLKKLKKKAQKVKAITVKNNKGKLSFKLVKKGITKKIRKLVKINSKGVITIKKWKKAKKGAYKIKVKITAKGNAQYNSKTVTKTVKVKVK